MSYLQQRQKHLNLGLVPGTVNVVWDDFEGVLKWEKISGASGAWVNKNTGAAYDGNACLDLYTGIALVINGRARVDAQRSVHESPSRRYRYECVWASQLANRISEVWFRVRAYTSDGLWSVGVGYDRLRRYWKFIHSSGLAYVIPGWYKSLQDNKAWHRIGFEFDLRGGKYIGFWCNEFEVDLSGYDIYHNPSLIDSVVYAQISLVGGWLRWGSARILVDNFLLLEI